MNELPSPYIYPAKLERVIDGDTVVLTLDFGYDLHQNKWRVRAKNVDTAEVSFVSHDSNEYKQGVEHTQFVKSWFMHAHQAYDGEWPLLFDSQKYERDNWQRGVGYIYRRCDGTELTDALFEEFGDAVAWES